MTLEDKAFHELAVIYAAEIDSYEVMQYAAITCAVRYMLKGVSQEFLETSIDDLSMATSIEITNSITKN